MQNMNKVIIDNENGSGVLPYLPLPELKKSTNQQNNWGKLWVKNIWY